MRNVLAGSERTLARLELDSTDGNHPWLQVEWNPNRQEFDFTSGPISNRNAFLYQTLGDPTKLPALQQVSLMADLIRASIMLSQDSLREFIEAEGSKRKPMLANLSGLGFYERCFEKTNQVVDIGGHQRRDTLKEIDELERKRSEISGQLAGEEQKLAAISSPEAGSIPPSTDEVKSRFERLGGQWPTGSLYLAEAAEAARIFCDIRAREIVQRTGEIEALKGVLPVLREHEQRQARLATETVARRLTINEASAREAQAKAELDKLRQERDRALHTVSTIDAAFGRLRFLEDTLTVDAHLLDRESRLRASLEEAARTRETARQGHATAIRHANELDLRFARMDALAAQRGTRAAKLRVLHRDIAAYNTHLTMLGDLAGLRQEAERRCDSATAQTLELPKIIEALRIEIRKIARAISESVAAKGEIARLAEAVRQRETNGDCPLCGKDHGSDAALHEAMDRVLATGDSATEKLREEEHSRRLALGEQERRMESLENEIGAQKRNIARMGTQIQEVDATFNLLVERARDLGLDSSESGLLAGVLAEAEQAEVDIKADRQLLDAERANFSLVRTEAETRLAQAERAVATAQANLSELLGQRTENSATRTRLLNALPSFVNVDPENLPGAVAALVSSRESERQEAHTRAESLATRLIEREAEQRASAEQRRIIGREISARELEAADCAARIAEYTARLRASNIPRDTAESATANEMEVLRGKLEEANSLITLLQAVESEARRSVIRSQCDRLTQEVSIINDEIRKNADDLNRVIAAIEQAEQWQELLRPALDGGVAQHLEQHRQEAFRLFRSLVPNAYQFTNVAVTSSKEQESVNLSLCYRGVHGTGSGEPRFFLSGAQSNALALSFFLSFARRQNWCRLRALLLDDPVQHLDDLDAVALLDLLREIALVREGPSQRQMVLSTCDLNLYRLTLRKFAVLEAENVRIKAYTITDGKGDRSPEAVPNWPLAQREQLAA